MLIKLTAVPHPDLNGGKPWPIYVDPRHVLFITRTVHHHVKLMHGDLKREVADDLYEHAQRLNKLLSEKWPNAIDTSEAADWAKKLHMAGHAVNEAYQVWARAYREQDLHPRVECTEIQLACGTALEHGVMLARTWVTESPEQVADLVEGPFAKGHP